MYFSPILWRSHIKNGVKADPQKIEALIEIPAPKIKKELQVSLVLLIIYVNFLLALEAYVNHFEN